MTTMTKSLDEKATFGLLFNLPFDSWYHFKDKHWRIVGNRRSESQMKNVNVIPYLFFSVPVTFLFLGTSVSSTLSVLEIMEEGKYTEMGEKRK